MNQIQRPTILALKQDFANEHLGTKANETKILGLNWDKQRNTIQSRNAYREQTFV